MNIVVIEELRAYIDPLTPEEHDALERSILAEGCRDALVLWGDVLVDGHNRYGICMKHGLPFQTVQNPRFQSMEDVHLWMIDQHLGRRSISDFQRGVLALRKKEILESRHVASAPQAGESTDDVVATADAMQAPWEGEVIAKAARQVRESRARTKPASVADTPADEVSAETEAPDQTIQRLQGLG